MRKVTKIVMVLITIILLCPGAWGQTETILSKGQSVAMASTRYVVKESDSRGGPGASFIVNWKADHSVNPPIIESVMIGTQGQQGLSFTSRG